VFDEVGGGKMALPAHRAEVFRHYSRPTSKKGLRSFLGAVSFYRRYLHQLASKVVWSSEGELAFRTICVMIANVCELCIPLPEDEYSIVTDASGLGSGRQPPSSPAN